MTTDKKEENKTEIKWDEKGEYLYDDEDMYRRKEKPKRISREEARRLKSLMTDIEDRQAKFIGFIDNKKVILEFCGLYYHI